MKVLQIPTRAASMPIASIPKDPSSASASRGIKAADCSVPVSALGHRILALPYKAFAPCLLPPFLLPAASPLVCWEQKGSRMPAYSACKLNSASDWSSQLIRPHLLFSQKL